MILAGDVGGTKTVLGLFEPGVNHLAKVREQTFASRDFRHLREMCERFLVDAPPAHIACFGVPGAVVDGACKTTNLPWILDERDLASTLHIPRVKLLNDLQAGALGMLQLRHDELVALNPGKMDRKKNIAVISPGTGLGEGLLIADDHTVTTDHTAVASEGGHATFAPQTEREVRLADVLRKRHGGHASWERVLSGAGLAALYDVMRDECSRDGSIEESPAVRAKLDAPGADRARVIGTEAVNGTDRLCAAAAEWFAALLGAEAGNVALKFAAFGGVFVGGGMAPKLLPILKRGAFAEAFSQKGRFASVLRCIPVYVALNDKAPLMGAARFAARA